MRAILAAVVVLMALGMAIQPGGWRRLQQYPGHRGEPDGPLVRDWGAVYFTVEGSRRRQSSITNTDGSRARSTRE